LITLEFLKARLSCLHYNRSILACRACLELLARQLHLSFRDALCSNHPVGVRDGSMTDVAAREAAYQPYSNQSILILPSKANVRALLMFFLADSVSCTSPRFGVSTSNHFTRAYTSTRSSVGPAYSGVAGLDDMFPRLSHSRKLAVTCPTPGMQK
jgi:hypothetical protein